MGWDRKRVLLEIIILMNKQGGEKATAIKVFVRVRPLVGAELGTNEVVEVEEDVLLGPCRTRLLRYQRTQCR